jgi:hypothetical protein
MVSFLRIYTQIVMVLRLLLASFAVISASAQSPVERPPRFEDYPVKEVFKGEPALPALESPEERNFEAVISDGVTKGWGVFDGLTRKEFRRPALNFAGHYILVNFGCGEAALSSCSGAAIVDAKAGHVYQAPSPAPELGFRLPYFGVFAERPAHYPPLSFHDFPLKSPFAYRLNSRLLIADICERSVLAGGSVVAPMAEGCGAHYYLMGDYGLTLIHRIVRDLILNQ